ncbi:hypothetical protein TWF106_007893 [Orbilia oligospora]|uniref:Peptidase S1 domain-containing protein n=1 Tax=Orbilia oligospora TaxID=2813651 RepID=A0A7C8QM55_ORBOL|nr:hypothetical protein TWF788_000667 [Orbilia oligospora]KAF3217585.1 hypothetical protein TWF106_007893 [Orbilia oligospora]
MPNTNMYCIMTAGHNIVHAKLGLTSSILVTFPNKLKFEAYRNKNELFAANEFMNAPALESDQASSYKDYGMIIVDRDRVKAEFEPSKVATNTKAEVELLQKKLEDIKEKIENQKAEIETLQAESKVIEEGIKSRQKSIQSQIDQELRKFDLYGCAFSCMFSISDLAEREGSVYGHMENSRTQTKNISRFSLTLPTTLVYAKKTKPGVSGGPVFVTKGGSDIAVGIHNYHFRATRLTYSVLSEMVSWINDYKRLWQFEFMELKPDPVKRKKMVLAGSGIYLHTTSGQNPNIVARPGGDANSRFQLIAVSGSKKVKHKPGEVPAPEAEAEEDFRFAILPARAVQATQKRRKPGDPELYCFLKCTECGPAAFSIASEPLTENEFCFAPAAPTTTGTKTTITCIFPALESNVSMVIERKKRSVFQCKCISQDDDVNFQSVDSGPCSFFLMSHVKDGGGEATA